jgi:hypothetical protein
MNLKLFDVKPIYNISLVDQRNIFVGICKVYNKIMEEKETSFLYFLFMLGLIRSLQIV